jgi:Xaa-Pro aminopeptidase
MTDALLLTHHANIEYLTDFKSSNVFALILGKKTYVFTDGRYLEKAQSLGRSGKARVGHFEVVDVGSKNFLKTIEKIQKKHRIKTLQYEANHITVARLNRFKKCFKKVKWMPDQGTIEAERALKSKKELRRIEKAQRISEQIFYSLKTALKPGVTELQIAQTIKTRAYEYGADEISFEPIVAFGSHSSTPHHENTTRKLKKGDLVLIDMGMFYHRHASDMTRMIFTRSPTPEQEKIYNLVLKAQTTAIDAMKPGIHCDDLDTLARKIISDAGYGETFVHSLGHGIGREVHEAPTLSTRSKDILKAGMVVTSEPGIYLPGKFGVRIEDMIAITSNGYKNLTRIPKAIRDCIWK